MLTQKEVKKYLDYNKDTGIFKWKYSLSKKIKSGDIVGSYDKNGYIKTSINKKFYQIHRLAWLYVYGEFPKNEIDHINRIKDDNRICNLRDVSRSINNKNKKLSLKNTSGYAGITWYKKTNKWRVFIHCDCKQIYVGCFKNIKEAICAKKTAENKYSFA